MKESPPLNAADRKYLWLTVWLFVLLGLAGLGTMLYQPLRLRYAIYRIQHAKDLTGFEYEGAYLKEVKGKAELVYDDNADGQGIEFFVVEGTKPTWEELQKLCGHNPRVKKEKSKKQLSNKLN